MHDNRLSILTYHAIDNRDSVISVTPEVFRRHMDILAYRGISGISLAQAFECLNDNGHFPSQSVVLTFDDGCLSVFEQALPVMQAVGFTGTVFIPTDFIGLRASEAREHNPDLDRDLMSWCHLEELGDTGFEIGAHTLSHPDLTSLNSIEVGGQLALARELLEGQLHRPVLSFAYPYGYCNEEVRNAASSHYRYACTTRLGHNQAEQDPLLLKRLDAYYVKRESTFIRACEGGLGARWWLRQGLRDFKSKMHDARKLTRKPE